MTALLRAPLGLFVIHTSCIAPLLGAIILSCKHGRADTPAIHSISLFNANTRNNVIRSRLKGDA